MREIKFRAWDKNRELMSDWHTIRVKYQLFNLERNSFGILFLQYTGLKDKNGKEIYEGDIVISKVYDGDKIHNYIESITFREAAFFWGEAPLNILKRMDEFEMGEIFKYHEVIGNIYENPELINKG